MIDNLTDKQKKFAAVIGIVLVIIAMYFIFRGNNKENVVETESMLVQNNSENNTIVEKERDETIIVHIAGAVKNPGVVKLKEGSRIEDAINLAGGLAEDADITNVNLAYVLDDGTKINIPRTSLEVDEAANEQEVIEEGSGENVIEEKENKIDTIRAGKY